MFDAVLTDEADPARLGVADGGLCVGALLAVPASDPLSCCPANDQTHRNHVHQLPGPHQTTLLICQGHCFTLDGLDARNTSLVSSTPSQGQATAARCDGGEQTDLYRLVAKNRPERALDLLRKYHGSGEMTPYVALEYEQIKASNHPLPKGIRDRWHFDTLLSRRGDGHRLFLGKSASYCYGERLA